MDLLFSTRTHLTTILSLLGRTVPVLTHRYTGLETTHALPLTQYKNLRATRVSRETRVNVLLLLKVSKKPLRNNSAEARSFWGQVSI